MPPSITCGRTLRAISQAELAPLRNGNLDPDPTFKGYCQAFPCSGGGQNDYCTVEIDTDDEWRSILAVTQLTALEQDPRFSSVDAAVPACLRAQRGTRALVPRLGPSSRPWTSSLLVACEPPRF